MNPSLEIDVQPSISLLYDSDRISKLVNEGNGSQVGGNKTRRGGSVGTSREDVYIHTYVANGVLASRSRNVIPLVESLVRRDRDANGLANVYKAGNCAARVTGLLKREIKTRLRARARASR